ncbi:olfactory receptor 6C75-like [Tachyglossus aculeatus]|uniref:olfactory receptor 6C75-like n=1 Tax=Tachyglossus aculeatus TaxID=9261 RepID=UPI0018F62E2A|nr:olfactory receptor 6C75-like [Tachyglossus aculeatus]
MIHPDDPDSVDMAPKVIDPNVLSVHSSAKQSSQREQATTENGTGVTEFILVEFTDDPHLQAPLLSILFLTYSLSVTGNLTIVTLTLRDSCHCTPMYFLLRSFSLLEVAFTSASIPRFLVTNPLPYTTVISRGFRALLGLCYCLTGFRVVFPPVIVLFHHDFCPSNIISHFICDSSPMLQLSCSDTRFVEFMAFLLALRTLLVTLALVTASYIAMICAILRLPSAQQRRKAFSTCFSHMVVVSMTLGSSPWNPNPSVLIHLEGNFAFSLHMIEMFRGLLCRAMPKLFDYHSIPAGLLQGGKSEASRVHLLRVAITNLFRGNPAKEATGLGKPRERKPLASPRTGVRGGFWVDLTPTLENRAPC